MDICIDWITNIQRVDDEPQDKVQARGSSTWSWFSKHKRSTHGYEHCNCYHATRGWKITTRSCNPSVLGWAIVLNTTLKTKFPLLGDKGLDTSWWGHAISIVNQWCGRPSGIQSNTHHFPAPGRCQVGPIHWDYDSWKALWTWWLATWFSFHLSIGTWQCPCSLLESPITCLLGLTCFAHCTVICVRLFYLLPPNVPGEPIFSVTAAGWFCEKSGGIGKVEDVKPVLFETKTDFNRQPFWRGGSLSGWIVK